MKNFREQFVTTINIEYINLIKTYRVDILSKKKSIDIIKKKSRLLCVSYFTKNSITTIMRVLIEKKKIITLIDKNEINTMTITLIKKIKEFLKTKCKFNVKTNKISKIFMKIKKEMLSESTFKIVDNAKSFLIFEKQ